MSDDEQGTGRRAEAGAEALAGSRADDRANVRSGAEQAEPAMDTTSTATTASAAGAASGAETEIGTAAQSGTEAQSGSEAENAAKAGSAGGSEMTARSVRSDRKQGSFWKELPILIGVALVLALVIKAFAVQAFYIPSQSMENTLKVGDRVLVNKIVYHTRDIQRGDIVVFNGLDSWDPENLFQEPTDPLGKFGHLIGRAFGVVPGEKDYIKRVIGVPGDQVRCCDAQGRVTVNGAPLDETSYIYTDPETRQQNKPSVKEFSYKVPAGRLWVMGDHREVSYDSRDHTTEPGGGSIPESQVIGRAFVIVWPLGRADTLSIPRTFAQPALAQAVAPAVPLALGLSGAVPVTLLWRRIRRRDRRGVPA